MTPSSAAIPRKAPWLLLAAILLLVIPRAVARGDSYTLFTNAPNAEEPRNYPMGPIGGQYRITDKAAFARVVSIEAGGPGAAAGLQPGDMILGVFGKDFPQAGQAPNGVMKGGHHGVSEELGFAVDRAEGADGRLPLHLIRPGVGRLQVTVQLDPIGAFGPTFPIASPKYDITYEAAVAHMHNAVMGGNGDQGYFTGWVGLCLLGHPDWDKTTGTKAYRASINRIRDFVIGWMNGQNYSPNEDWLYDGTRNPNFKSGASNWQLGNRLMFLAEYYQRTKNTDDPAIVAQVRAAMQRGAELAANNIQWWKQPSLLGPGGYSPSGPAIAGMTSHGGVTGDYIHLGWGGGINICGGYGFMGMSFARRAGADMTVRPIDGHYFGYTKQEFQTMLQTPGSKFYGIEVVEPGKELYDHTVQEKFLMHWKLRGHRNAGYSTPGDLHDGHTCYQFEGWNPGEAVGKTAATIVGMMMYQEDGGQLTADDIDRLNRMKLFITRNYMNVQDSHAYCVGAQGMLTLAIPFLNDRQQRFAFDNWRFFHALGRNKDQRFLYFRSRYVNDNYLGEDMPMAVNVALPGAVLNGRLSLLPGLNRNRILARFDNPNLRWPEYEARHLKSNSRTVPMPFTVFDGNGVQLNPSNYQVQWSKVSGLGNVTFADDQITFATDGSYRVTLTVTRGSYVLEEPIDVVIQTLPIPQGHVAGSANYDVYKDIPGSDVYSLVTHWKFPDFPDEHYTLKSSEGDWSGDRYGSRLSGVIVAPVTGTYRFYIDSADGSQLRINTNGLDGAKGPVVATFYSGSGDRRVFNVSPTQASGEYLLNEGQAIGFEALHKEDGWSDHLSVAWSINGSQPVVIPGDFLAHAVVAAAPMAFLAHPASVRTTLGADVTLSVSASGPAPAVLQWRCNGQRIEGANSPTLVLNDIGAGADAEYDCTFTSLTGTITSKKARVSIVDVGLTVAGALWREVYTGIGGTAVSDLTTHSKFPYQADQSGPLTSLSTGDLGDSYGQRWTGWITPPTSGNYRFYLVSDDSAELFLSTDATIGKAVSIVANPSWKNSKQWSANAPSAWKALVGGQKYYIEVRHKEGGGGDNCAVAWQREGDPAPVNGTGEIPGSVLSYRTGGIYPDTLLDNAAPWFDPATIEGSLGFSGRAYGGVSLATYVVDPNSMDLPALVFSKVSGPAWLQVAANGTLSGTPGAGHVGPNEFTVRVTDPGGLAATATLRIQVQTPNTAPTFVANPAVKGGAVSYGRYEGQTLAGDVTDPDAWEALSFEKISGPSWLEVSPHGGLGGIPTFAHAGTNAFVVRVTDKAGDSATATLNVVVDPVRAALTINGRTGSGATRTGFNKNETLTVSTAVSRGFGVITGVDFYVGQTLLGSDSTDPYSVDWTAVPAGTHVVTAKVKTSTAYATFDLSPVTIHVEDPPVVPTRTHVATTAMPIGRRVGLAIATPGAGRTMAGWTLLNETNRFAINNQGEITLLQPANIGTGEAITLRVRATDNLGITGEGAVNILGNPPVTTTVSEQRWAGTTAYNNQDWSGTPSYTGTLTTFTTASNVGENYSRRITGFIQAPVTGDYRFWVASDDNSRVYLGSDETGSSKSLIITAPYAPNQNWDYKAEQKSGLQRLVGGRIYWLEVHHLEIGGGDYASVAWSGPGFARRALGGADVYPLQKVSDVAWVGLNAPVTGGELYKGQVLSLTTTVVEGTSAITRVEFRSGDTLLGSDTTAPYTLDWQNIPDGRQMLTATAVTADGSVTSEAVQIDVVFRPFVVVVAADKSKLQGQPNPVFNARYVGLMPWDSTNLLSGQVSLSCPATASSPVGLYSIGVTGPATLANYTVYYQPGILTVRSVVEVVGRWVFYNRSGWDGNDAAANAGDDAAVAPDKSALLPGRKATFANYTSYASGLNGVMVDVFGLPAGNSLTASDFEFRAGNTQTPSGWATASTPSSVGVRRGAGVGGSDRVTMVWVANNGDMVADANEAVAGRWLQVTVKANARTGLAVPDTFYFGSAPGETGNSPTDFWVTTADANAAAQSLTVPNGAGLSSRFDFNRNKSVELSDSVLARARLTAASTALVLLDLGSQAGQGTERRPAGLMAEDVGSGMITVPEAQRPTVEARLSADGREVMLRVRDDGLPWKLQRSGEVGGGTWIDVERDVEPGDDALTWRVAVGGEHGAKWYRVVIP